LNHSPALHSKPCDHPGQLRAQPLHCCLLFRVLE
jgi:hypothetical protein